MTSMSSCRHFEFHDILSATNNFDESLVIGHGGFGKVYKGNIMDGSSSIVVAMKRLDTMSSQGADEFWAEVETLSVLRHCNLVSLIGYCNHGKEMILVYEYMSNGTLEDHLHKLGTHLSWIQRLKICIGAGRGIHYLHTGTGIESGVIHRDVKSSNILLHERWAAKISDFGLSKISPTNQPKTYVNTLVKGTFGYLDPDYYATGKLTRKSDVYAFGVVMLELLCRKRALDRSLDEEQWNLARWVQESIKQGNLKHIVDPDIKGEIAPKCLKEFVRIAEKCLHSYTKQRSTMAQVLASLENVLILQEKYTNSLQPVGRTLLGRLVNMLPFSSNGEKSGLLSSAFGNEDEAMELPLLSFTRVANATVNFSLDNKLGEGGFGLVYKGVLEGGIEVAVKRLSKTSAQGVNEFKNEVICISKLQHRNLVKLLGCCIQGDEKLLVYEYMPNRSLDSFIFDETKSKLLDWTKRFNIIMGIARGLLYLNEGSSLRIIHRDIKPGNILLDEDMNPKIHDFSVARTFGGSETQANTERIVGTYGYMSPEYVIDGVFSIKSDVFSFGVLLLEIVNGKKKYGIRSNENGDNNLIGHAWILYNEGRSMEMIDASLVESCHPPEVLRSIAVGLLCVQHSPGDRPNMSDVIQMLGGEGAVPEPKEPACFTKKDDQWLVAEYSSSTSPASTINDAPITDFVDQ